MNIIIIQKVYIYINYQTYIHICKYVYNNALKSLYITFTYLTYIEKN